MQIKSTFSKSFSSFELNEVKFEQLKNKAEKIREFKNIISNKIHKNINTYINKSKFELVKEFNTQIKDLSGQEIQIAIGDVYDTYLNKFNQIKNKMIFKIQKGTKVRKYKVNSKNHIKGDVMSFELQLKSTKLTKVMSFLCRYGYYGISKDLKKKTFKDKNKELFYKDVVQYLDRFSEERLLKLALNKRISVLNRYNKEAIRFKSLNYRSISRVKMDIVKYNKNFNSSINAFINIGGFKNGVLQIPTRYSKKYHNRISAYQNKKGSQNTTSYTVIFKDKNKINISIPIDGVREIPDALENTNYLGVDVNIKNNLFCLEDGNTIDFDRNMVQDYVDFLKYLDNKKKNKTNMGLKKEEISRLSSKDFKTYSKAQTKIKNMIKEKCNHLIKQTKESGKNHLVLEDLKLLGKLFSKSDEFHGFRYSRLIRFLNLSDVKNILTSIAHKHGVSVSFINSEYTSQMCSKCKHVEKGNRKKQEEFKCLKCGFEFNADANSALNIKNRVLEDVLVKRLLMRNDFNEFIPKNKNRYEVKEIILSYSSSLASG